MSEQKSFQQIGQAGEFLAGLELIRRGFQVRIFGGTFPGIDLLAIDKNANQFPIQVKAIRGTGAWQFNAVKYMKIRFEGRKQIVESQLKLGNPDIINIFIKLIDLDAYRGEYFLLRRQEVQDILVRNYRRWLDNHHGIRPKKPESTHCSIITADLEPFKDNWQIFNE